MKTILAALLLSLVGASGAFATEILNFSTPGANYTNGSWTLGFEFTVNAPIEVTGLSIYDSSTTGGSGLNGPSAVGLWTSGGSLLASTTVQPSGTLDGDFRVGSIAPLTLGVGNYVVGAENNGAQYMWDPTGLSTIPQVTFDQDLFSAGSSLAFPTSTVRGVNGFFGGNVQLGSSVPDYSSTLVLLAIGLVSLAVIRRKQSQTS